MQSRHLTRILAADPRPPASSQLGDEEEEIAPYLKPGESLPQDAFKSTKSTEKKKPAKPEQSEQDEQQDEQQDEEPQSGDVKTGKSLKSTKDRFAHIESYSPFLFIVSGVGRIGTLLAFFQDSKNIINDSTVVERIAGLSTLKASETDPLKLTFAYLVSFKVINHLVSSAAKLLVHKEDFSRKMGSSSPFTSSKLPPELEKALGGSNLRRLQEAMLTSFKDLKQSEASEAGAVAALQMQSTIPLDYLRWLSKDNRPHEAYIGGEPADAGRQGNMYVLCSETEANLLITTAKDFKPPNSFFEDLYYVANIDSGFKKEEPRKLGKPHNCLLLTFEEKFDVNNLKGLHEVASKIAGKELKPYNYVDGNLVKGDLVAHFSKDFMRCVLWLGTNPIAVKPEQEKQLKEEFHVGDIDTTFAK